MKARLAAAFCLVWLAAAPAVTAAASAEPGMLLVARPGLPDVRFSEAVVLIVQHGPAGTAGLILNRPSRLALAEVLPELPASAGREGTLSYGGPVAPRGLLALVKVTDGPPEPAEQVLAAVYLTGPAALAAWLGSGRPDALYRVFAGYAGWAPGQLHDEVERGDWQVMPADERLLFSADVAGLWQELAVRSGDRQP